MVLERISAASRETLEPPRLDLVRGVMAALVALLVFFPRYVPLFTVVTLVTAFVWQARYSQPDNDWPNLASALRSDTVTQRFGVLIAVLMVACIWAVEPLDSFLKVFGLGLVGVLAISVWRMGKGWSDATVIALTQGLVIGMAIASIYIAIETLTDRELTRQIHTWIPQLRIGYEKHYRLNEAGEIIRVSHSVINRATFAYSSLFWPALLGVYATFHGRTRFILGAILVVTAASILANSTHQSSQLALVVSSVVVLIGLVNVRLAKWSVGLILLGLFLLIVPFSLYAEKAGWHANPWVHRTAQARLILWGYTAERVLENPIFGVGTNSTRALDEARPRQSIEKPKGYVKARRTTAHPHNIFLQLWYETGVLGVLAALAFFLALLGRAGTLGLREQQVSLAHYAMLIFLTMASYSVWQTWFQAVVGLSAMAMLLSAGAYARTHKAAKSSTAE